MVGSVGGLELLESAIGIIWVLLCVIAPTTRSGRGGVFTLASCKNVCLNFRVVIDVAWLWLAPRDDGYPSSRQLSLEMST